MENSYKSKWSNFHITVQTNTTSGSAAEGVIVRRLRRAVEEMVNNDNLWEWLKWYNEGRQKDFTADEKFLVERIRLRCAIEGGGATNHGLHAHIVMEVMHKTMVQINKFGIQDVFQRILGFQPNVHVRFLKGDSGDKNYILKYITKEVPTERTENVFNNQLKDAFNKGDIVTAKNSFPN